MTKLAITLATWNYDRVQPIIDGRVTIEGCDVNHLVLAPHECFHRAYLNQEFEVSEIGMSPYLIAVSRGQAPYVAVPVFLSRMFRHSAIYIRTDAGIRTPKDLVGRKVGVTEFQSSAALWARGALQDIYGVQPRDMHWRQGGLNNPGTREKFPLNLPPGFPLETIGGDETLSALLQGGQIDVVISASAPSCYGDGKSPVARLFEDFESVEREYYRDTGIFPIMHALGVRQDIHARHPWLAASLYKAFSQAKAIALAELAEIDALKISLPWVVSHQRATRALMGEDFWPYGIEPSRRTLEAMTRYSYEQGLSLRQLAIEELFAAGTLSQGVI